MALDVELAEIRDFLAEHAPYAWLPAPVLERLPSRLSIVYRRRGSLVLAAGEVPAELLVVRSIEDTLLLAVPADELTALCAAHPDLAAYFVAPAGGRLRRAVTGARQQEGRSGRGPSCAPSSWSAGSWPASTPSPHPGRYGCGGPATGAASRRDGPTTR